MVLQYVFCLVTERSRVRILPATSFFQDFLVTTGISFSFLGTLWARSWTRSSPTGMPVAKGSPGSRPLPSSRRFPHHMNHQGMCGRVTVILLPRAFQPEYCYCYGKIRFYGVFAYGLFVSFLQGHQSRRELGGYHSVNNSACRNSSHSS